MFQGLPLPLIPCLLFLGLGTLPTQVIHVPFSLLLSLLWNLGFHHRQGSPYPQCLPTGKANVREGTRNNLLWLSDLRAPSGGVCCHLLPVEKKKRFFSLSILCFKFVGHLSCTNCKSNSTLDTLVGVGIRAFLCQPYLYYFFFFYPPLLLSQGLIIN